MDEIISVNMSSGFVVHLELRRVKTKAVTAKSTKTKESKKP